jgi:NADH:ubiquinone oxidoreductase subunit 4 (subunit M)
LIPTLFLILGWVYQTERIQAGIYLLFYTSLASLPLLFGILFIYNSVGSLCLFLLCDNSSLVGVLLKLGECGLLRVFPVLFQSGFRFGVA